MRTLRVKGAEILGVECELGAREVDNRETCRLIFGERAEAVLKTAGILKRRVAEPGETSAGLCVKAAKRLMERLGIRPEEIAAVVSVSFTPEKEMPGNAHLIQSALGLRADTAAVDLGHACAGYVYGLYAAASLARDLGGKVLLADGDVQTKLASMDTAVLLSDAGSATIVAPGDGDWKFAFWTDGTRANELKVEDGKLKMDGFGVFKFVASDVSRWAEEFLAGEQVEKFVPHQANVYMARELAKKLKLEAELMVSGDEVGNCASASIPVTLAMKNGGRGKGRTFLAGFGGGLSAAMALVDA